MPKQQKSSIQVTNIIPFTPKGKTPADNLEEFNEHCQKKLSIYKEQGGFNVNSWKTETTKSKVTMRFSIYNNGKNNKEFAPFEDPFLLFAKSYIRYKQSIKESSAIKNEIVVLQVIYEALTELYAEPDILKTDGLVQQKSEQILNKRYPGSDRLYRYGGSLETLYSFLIKKGFTPALPRWKHPWKRRRSKADRTDQKSREWQEGRCPSRHVMLSLADCFSRATTPEDRYWSSVLTLLMFAPGRAGELQDLTVDCLGEEDGYHYISWIGEKGFGATRKWIPNDLIEPVKEAIQRLIEIGQPAREAAKFAYENPDRFMRHPDCNTPDDFPEYKPLNALELAHAMHLPNTIKKITKGNLNPNGKTAHNDAFKAKWSKKLLAKGPITYQSLAKYTLSKYKDRYWPKLGASEHNIWDSLLLVRENEFHKTFETKAFSWTLPDANLVNDQLKRRLMPTIFQRFGLKDENGDEIGLTSHQLRVWLSTMAERGGMDSWQLAQWAGRSRIQDNRHYDLRTNKERIEQSREILLLTERPTALQAIKLNLPVAYADLGINRVGVADITEYGMCIHDYAMSPCLKGGECMTCKEHVCIKGMPKTLGRIKQLKSMVASQLEKAKKDASSGAFGADRWVTHLGWKLAHISTMVQLMESNTTPEGAVLWVPPEHDPSPIRRALQEQGQVPLAQTNSPSIDSIKKLLEL